MITLCDRVREVCPEFPAPTNLVHWSMANPVGADETDVDNYPAFERTAAELEMRLRFLLPTLGTDEQE